MRSSRTTSRLYVMTQVFCILCNLNAECSGMMILRIPTQCFILFTSASMCGWEAASLSLTVEEEHGLLTFYNDWLFSLPHFHFKSINISTILTSKLKMCVYICRLVSWLLFAIYIFCVESSVNKQIYLDCVLFFHGVSVG